MCVCVSQALAGEVGMSSELDEVARALFNGQIPAIWRKLAPDTLKSLGNWMIHFRRRYDQYSSWVRLNSHPSLPLRRRYKPRAGLLLFKKLMQKTCSD